MVAKTLMDNARGRLGDIQKLRWTDTRLLQIVNQGQASICKLTGIHRKEAYLALANGQVRYRLPTDCMTVKRLEFRGKVIVLFNRDDLDVAKQGPNDFVGIKDNLGMGVIEIEPPLIDLTSDIVVIEGASFSNTFDFNSEYGVVVYTEEPFTVAPLYGVVAGVALVLTDEDLDDQTTYGEVSGLLGDNIDDRLSFSNINGVTTAVAIQYSDDSNLYGFVTASEVYKVVGQYGLVSSVVPQDNTLKVYYQAVPTDLNDSKSDLVIPDMWEEAMMRYLVGTALQDDNDASNIQRGELELQKYTQEVLKARELSTKDFSAGTKEKYNTRYRRI